MRKKFKLVPSSRTIFTGFNKKVELFRIKALRDIAKYNVKKGDWGGFVEKESNLSHKDSCWILPGSEVARDAMVLQNALVGSGSIVTGNAMVYDNARITDFAIVREFSAIGQNAIICGSAQVQGYARVYGNAIVKGSSTIEDQAIIAGNAIVDNFAYVRGDSVVKEDAEVTRSPLCIYNYTLTHNQITFTDYHIRVGDIQMLYPEWLEISTDDMRSMKIGGRCKLDDLKELLTSLIKIYYK